MPYDIRRTRAVEPDEVLFVSTRDQERERCVVCLDPFTAEGSRVPMPPIGAIPAGNAHDHCASLARPGYDRALALGDGGRTKPAALPRPFRRTA